MFESFYHLNQDPFSQRPDPRFVFLAPPHRTALMMMEDMLAGESAFCLVTGEPGVGKTTLIHYLLTRIARPTNVGMKSEMESEASLMQTVCRSFELPTEGRRDFRLARQFKRFVAEERANNHHVLLILDDADRLSAAQLLALTELSRGINRKSLQLQTILVGQRRLRGVIRSPQLLSLADRVGADCDLGELSPVDARRYVYHRLRAAGGRLSTFTETAIQLIHDVSGGLPRLINQYCGLGLLRGAAMGAEVINARMMMDIIEEHRASMAMAS